MAICAACGVAVVFVPELPGTRASGVARWLTPAKALIQLSLRYRTDDHLWFTFFHEIAHVLRHGKTDVWIDVLISRMNSRNLPELETADDVQRFAEGIGVAPGIVVGRLQHDSHWPYSQGNELKRQLLFPNVSTGE